MRDCQGLAPRGQGLAPKRHLLWRLEHAVENGEVVVESFDKVRLEEDKAGYSQRRLEELEGAGATVWLCGGVP